MWNRKKSQTKTLNTPDLSFQPVEYPAGVAVVTGKGRYFINKDGKRYRIPTQRIFDSWNFPIALVTTEDALKKYPVALRKLGFRDGTLLNNIADGKLYLVSGQQLRHVMSPAVLDRLGVSKDAALVVSDTEIKVMEFGEDIY